jgi:TPR repeat protein
MLSKAFHLRAGLALGLLTLGLLFGPSAAQSATPQAEARFQAGRQSDERNDYATARREYGQACEAGHLEACTWQASLWADGAGGPADLPGARALFAKACVVGMAWSEVSVAEACHMLAVMTEEGLGGPSQPARAAYLSARGCDLGIPEACDALLNIMVEDEVLPLPTSGETFLPVGLRACLVIDFEYCPDLLSTEEFSEFSASGFEEALALFNEAHSLPDTATLYQDRKWRLTDSCGLGLARACARAAWEWKHGFRNQPVDQGQAATFYTFACLLGDGAGCSEAGDAARSGVGTSKDLGMAAQYYSYACQLAYPSGCQSLAGMHRRGEIAADLPLARKLERFVCDAILSCVPFAAMLIEGIGGAQDLSLARQLLKAECDELGPSAVACRSLARLGG